MGVVLNVKGAINKYLSDSIQQIGLLHPICVRPNGDHFELIAEQKTCRMQELRMAANPVPCSRSI